MIDSNLKINEERSYKTKQRLIYHLEYERIIGGEWVYKPLELQQSERNRVPKPHCGEWDNNFILQPKYRDIKINVYIDDDEIVTIYFWVDCINKKINITSGYFHNEPLPKEIVDDLINKLKLTDYTIK